MSDHSGGIFDINSVLGMPTALDGDGQKCTFYSSTQNDAARQVQQKLVSMGVQGLSVDGLWGACSEDAFQLVFGEPTSAAALGKHLNIACGEFVKSIGNQCAQEAIYMPAGTQQTFQPKLPQISQTSPQPNYNLAPQTSQQIQYPPHTTQPIELPPRGGPAQTIPMPYTPPGNMMLPGAMPAGTTPTTPWLKYGLIVAGLGGLGLFAYWYFMLRKESESELPPVPGGRTVPVGTIE